MARGSKPVCVASLGDTHINKLMALLKPGIAVDDGSDFALARAWLWNSNQEFLKHFLRVSKGCKRVLLLGGDIGEFDAKKYTNQLVSRDKCEIKNMAIATLDPWTDPADEIHVIGGTGAHTGIACEFERWLADDLGATFHWLFFAEIGGVLVDAAHYTSSGRMTRTNGNAAVRLASETVMNYAGERIPRFVFRYHVHHYEDSFENIKGCRAVISPCWTFHDEYENGIGLGQKLPDIGGIILRCENGKGDLEIWRKEPKRKAALII